MARCLHCFLKKAMKMVSPCLARSLTLTFDLLKALEENNKELIYELKEKIKIYKAKNHKNIPPDRYFHQQKMQEHIVASLIQRQRSWIEQLWHSINGESSA